MLTRRQYSAIQQQIVECLQTRLSRPDRPFTQSWRKFSQESINQIATQITDVFAASDHELVSVAELKLLVLGITIFADIDFITFIPDIQAMLQSISNYKAATGINRPLTDCSFLVLTDTTELYNMSFGAGSFEAYLSGYGITTDYAQFY